MGDRQQSTAEEIFKEGRLYLDKNRENWELVEQKILSLDADTCFREHGWEDIKTRCNGSESGDSPRATRTSSIQSLTEKSRNSPRTFFQANDTSDLRLSVEGKPLYVSRILLSIVSPVLKDMFDKRSKEQAIIEIPLPGQTYSDILEFLECIYPDSLKPISGTKINSICIVVKIGIPNWSTFFLQFTLFRLASTPIFYFAFNTKSPVLYRLQLTLGTSSPDQTISLCNFLFVNFSIDVRVSFRSQ